MQLPSFNLAEESKKLEIIQLTIAQIQKDMNFELNISANAETIYDELFAAVKNSIQDQLENSPSTLFPLLYRIDISEVQLRKVLNNLNESPIDKITQMIIERELKKVLMRKFFSEGKI